MPDIHYDLGLGYAGMWELPDAVVAPTAVLIRPDGYVAWVGGQTFGGRRGALGDNGPLRAIALSGFEARAPRSSGDRTTAPGR
jgi:hypothetical protein